MSTKWFASTALLVLLPVLAIGQQPPRKWSGRVQVKVAGHDEEAVTLVKSYVNRELRALGDVVVTDSEPEYLLEIVVSGFPSGYAISWLGAQHVNADWVKALLKQGDTKPEIIETVKGFLEPVYFT